MDLASMIERENFFELFLPTIEKYYKEVHGQEIRCELRTWGGNLISYPFLSAFTMRQISETSRGFFLSEWNIREKTLKNLAAKTYIQLVTRSRGLFAKYRIEFQPAELLSPDLVLAPSNRSIRVFDYKTGVVGCIIKKGFTDKYFNQQLDFRRKNPYKFIPPLIAWSNCWFSEPILYGHPLARIRDDDIYQKGMEDAALAIAELVVNSLEYRDSIEYAKELNSNLIEGLVKARKTKHIKKAAEAERIIKKLCGILGNSRIRVPVALSHGDLQTGNIWVDNERKTWIYDWETAGIRSVWYDMATLLLSTRRQGGLERLWHQASVGEVSGLIIKSDERKDYTALEMHQISAIVLMEDIMFYMEDMLELPADYGSVLFDRYIDRLVALGL